MRQNRFDRMAEGAFEKLDTNIDGMLDSAEIFKPPFEFVALLRLADRNGDGKLSKSEYRQFLELRKKMVTRGLTITLVDRGRSLFDLWDTDHDHRLGRRELMSAWERIALWSAPGADDVPRSRIPRQFQVIVSQGPLPRVNSDPGAASAVRPEARLRGPAWFRKMDRNADGDLTLVEFMGTAEQFRQLDRDGDGLISLKEAEAATQPQR
jgi:Ca2+-binding EF-hand superfamily protein